MAKALTTGESPAKIQSYELTNNDHTKHLATVVASFIDEKKLFTTISGKKYVNVEGWLYAGSQLGILPIIVKTDDISREYVEMVAGKEEKKTEIRYRAEAKLVNILNQQEVGYGVAMCSNKEVKKKYFDEYAIMSMSETRAVGKAYRLMIGWLMSAAGYSPTPYEEMDNVIVDVVVESKPVKPIATEPVNSKKQSAEIDTAVQNYTEPVVQSQTQPVTINQKTQILLLLNNSMITKEEKEKMVAKLNTFDTVRGDQAIAKLKKTIRERSLAIAEETGEIAKGELVAEIDSLLSNPVILDEEREQIREHIASCSWLASEAKAALQMIKERISRTQSAA